MSENGKKSNRISLLFQKYLNETCSEEKVQEVLAILEDSNNDPILSAEAKNQWEAVNIEQQIPAENRLLMNRILDHLHHRIRLHEEKTSEKYSMKKRLFFGFSKVAAVLILPLLGYSIYLTSKTSKTLPTEANPVVWQTVKTPVGMQTDFSLPDGSHVWLNSGSVFKYPLSFTQDKRLVELTGEAFFDVAKDASHPFLVMTGKMNIEVKGTKFNVINYPEESTSELILESGSVRLFTGNYEDNKTIAHINPGELASFDLTNNQLKVSDVDVDKYTAWRDGKLIFRDDSMEEVVRKLNRWFNVEIILQSSELEDYVYTATYQYETLPQILELLKISAPVNYSITERKRMNDNTYTKRKIVITKRE